MPVVQWAIDASGYEAEAQKIARANETIRRSALEARQERERFEQARAGAASPVAAAQAEVASIERVRTARRQQASELGGLGTEINQLRSRIDALSRSEAELARQQDRRIRVGLTALSTLGDESRAFAQLTQFQIRQAQALGENIDRGRILAEVQARLAASGERAAEVFSRSAVNSRDLRLNMQGLNNVAQQLLRALGPGGGVGGALSILGPQFSAVTGQVLSLGLGLTGLGPIAAAVNASLLVITAGLGQIAREGEEAQRSLLRLQGIQRATGGASGFTGEEIQAQAKALALATNTSSDALEVAAARLLTFREISGETFTRTLSLATDMAEVFGGLESATAALGRALANPVENFGALRRAGVAFTDAQEDQIRSLAESGRLMEAQGLILDVLSGKMGGTAVEAARGMTGAWNTLRESLESFFESADRNIGVTAGLESAIRGLASGVLSFASGLESNPAQEIAALNQEIARLEDLQKRLGGGGATGIQGTINALKAERDAVEAVAAAERKRVEDARAAGVAAQAALEAERAKAALAGLRLELDPAARASKEFAATQASLAAALRSGAADQETYTELLGIAIERYEKATGATKDYAEALREEQREAQAVADVIRRLQEEHDAAAEAAIRAQQAEQQALKGVIDRLQNDQDRAEADAARNAERQAEAAARAARKPFETAAESIQQTLATGISQGLRGSITSVREFADTMLGIFADTAGQIAALLVFRPVLEGIAGGSTGGGGIFGGLGGIFGGRDVATSTGLPSDASRDEVLAVLRSQEEAAAETATNTGGILGFFGKLGAGIAGAGAGFGLAQLLGLRTGAGSAVGGAAGSLIGSFAGPGGSATIGALGALLGGEASGFAADILAGRNPFEGRGTTSRALRGAGTGAAIGSVVPVIGTGLGAIVGALVAALHEGQKTQVALLTSATQGGQFRAGISQTSPFGFVGLDAARSQGLGQESTKKLAEAVAVFDRALAAAIDPGLIDEVTAALINTPALRESAQGFDREFNSLLVDRAATVVRAALSNSGVTAETIDQIVSTRLPKAGSAGRDPGEIANTVEEILGNLQNVNLGRRELRGEEIAEGEQALRRLNDRFRELTPLATEFGIALTDLQADLAAGQERIRSDFRNDLRQQTLAIVDPFRAAISEIVKLEADLGRETLALGTGAAEAAALIAASREELARQATEPVTSLLDQLRLDRASPAERLGLLGDRFNTALQGNDANALAQAAQALLQQSEQSLGRTSQFFEREQFIELSLQNFANRLRDEALNSTAAINAQTSELAIIGEEGNNLTSQLLAENKAIKAEMVALRAELRDVLSRLAA